MFTFVDNAGIIIERGFTRGILVGDRTQRLRALMTQHGLTARQVGEVLNRTPHTVRCWRCSWDARTIPEHALALLEIRFPVTDVAEREA